MRQNCYLFVAMLALYGCGKPAETSNNQDTVQVQTEIQTPPTPDTAVYEGQAIITTPNVPVLNTPSLSNAGVITHLQASQLVKVMEAGEKLVTEPEVKETNCDSYGYHYYLVSFKEEEKDITGWVYGKYLYLINPGGDQPISSESFQWVTLFKLQFEMNFAFSDGMGPSDSNGLTGCDQFYLVLLKNIETGKIVPIKAPESALAGYGGMAGRDAFGNLRLVAASEGGRTIITSWEAAECSGQPSIKLTLKESYQDGGATYTICLSFSEDGEDFVVSSIDKVNPQD